MKELLLNLKQQDIDIEVVDNELRLSNIPDGFEASNLMQTVRDQKDALIHYITKRKKLNHEGNFIPAAGARETYEVSPQQRRLFFVQQIMPESLAYNIPQAFEIRGDLSVPRLEDAFRQLIARHESLRTTFAHENKKVVQKIAAGAAFRLDCAEAAEAEIGPMASAFIRPFDLAAGPLLRVKLIGAGPHRHILLIDLHHIISDGISQEILVGDFTALYGGAYLPPLHLQYKDYSEWFHRVYQDQASELERFWVNEFKALPAPLQLPLDFTRPDEKNFRGAAVHFSLEKQTAGQLNQLARRAGTSLFTVLISAFGALLSKLGNNEDVVIGTPVSGRTHADLEGVIGLFVNTLPIRLSPGRDLPFNAYLQQAGRKVVACFDHQEYPYDQLVDKLGLERDLSHNPLFDVLFVLQNMDGNASGLGDLEVNPYPLDHGSAKFDLSLAATEDAEGIHFNLEYATQLFGAATVERFAGYLQRILREVAAAEDVRLGDLRMLAPEEEQYLLAVNDYTRVDYPREATLVGLFEAQAARHPYRVALVAGDRAWTYGEVNRHANRLARTLLARGAARNAVVGLLMDKGALTVVGMLGILKAGAAYLPIDADYPEERIRVQLENSRAALVVSRQEHAGKLDAGSGCVLIDGPDVLENDPANPGVAVRPDDLCYVLYTSGTTGKPKGVMIEHRNVVRLLFNGAFQFRFSADDVWVMFHSPSFDFSVWEMYGALLYGGKLVILDKHEVRDPLRVLGALRTHGVTVLNQTPTAFANLTKEDLKGGPSLHTLRYVIFGGEALQPFKLKKWHACYPDVKLVNMYGITETTVHVTYKEIGREEIRSNQSNIGKPIPTTALYLLDDDLRLTPAGGVGELFVGGEGVARGYLHNEELTRQRFVDNPYVPGQKLYRSGDLGRLRENGEIEYLGRADRQVQLRGFRVEPSEIEFQLLPFAGVDDATVVVQQRPDGSPYLCAYYVGRFDIPGKILREYLQDKMPAYMIPSYFVRLDAFPRTVNDKIDVAQLPLPATTAGSAYVAPQTATEETLAAIWSRYLSAGPVGLDDNFFGMGGDSLIAIGLIYEINATLGARLNIADLYKHQTVGALAGLITPAAGDRSDGLAPARQELAQFQADYQAQAGWDESYEAVFPMSGIEQGMVFHSLRHSSGKKSIHDVFYHEQNVYGIPAQSFDFGLFRKAIGLLVEKHGELRKVYDLKHFAHIVKKHVEPELHYLDVSDLEPEAQEAFVLDKIEAEKLRATALDQALIWRMNVLKINPNFALIVFDMHHSLFDGWSLQSFITELNRTYVSLLGDPSYRPAPLQCSFADHIAYELAQCRDAENIAFWKQELVGSSKLKFARKATENHFKYTLFKLGEDLQADLERVAKRYDTTLKHLCFAAYVHTWKLYAAAGDDLLVGMVTNNRPIVPDGEKLLGCFLNSVPFRIAIPDTLTFGEYITRVENKLQVLKRHEKVPFQEIIKMAGERPRAENAFFDTFFNYTNFWVLDGMLSLEGEEAAHNPYQDKIDAESYLNLNTFCEFHVSPNPFKVMISFATAYFSDANVEVLFGYFRDTLRQFVDNADGRLGDAVFAAGTDGPSLPEAGATPPDAYLAPRTPPEAAMAALWSGRLAVERVGVRDNYFRLGGDCRNAVGLVADINGAFRTNFTLADLYANPTIEELLRQHEAARTRGQDELFEAVADLMAFQQEYRAKNGLPEDCEDVFPMNGIEKAMVAHSPKGRQSDPGVHAAYHEQLVYPIAAADFDPALFERALRLMMAKHGALRKVYDLKNQAHLVRKEAEPPLSCLDLSGLSPAEQDVFLRNRQEEARLQSMVRSHELLWRMTLVKLGADRHVLQFDMHQSLLDGWSLSSFCTELNQVYGKLRADRAFVPARLGSTHRDQVLAELAAARKPSGTDYWKDELKDYTRFQLVKTSRKPAFASAVFDLDAGLKQQLAVRAAEQGTNLRHLCFAAYLYTMKLLAYNNDLLVGMIAHNRPVVADGEKLLGCYLNPVPFRARLEPGLTWRGLIGYVEGKLRAQKEHEQVPFGEIVRVAANQAPHENPLFDISFQYTDVAGGQLPSGPVGVADGAAGFDSNPNAATLLDFHVLADAGLQLTIRYSTSVLEPAFEERLFTYYRNILLQCANQPDALIDHTAVLGPQELDTLLKKLNDTACYDPAPQLVLHRFEAQVAATPHRLAVQGEERSMTYGQFNRQANRMAHLLRERGVQHQSVVGVLLSRSEDMLVCIYALMKLGAVYLPLDVSNPLARNQEIVSAAKAGFLLFDDRPFASEAFGGLQISIRDVEKKAYAEENLRAALREDDIAYILFTSGSTGKPKGVPIRQNALYNRLNWMQKKYPLSPADKILHKTRTTFDVSMWEIFWWSLTGAGVCVLPEGEERDVHRIMQVIGEREITVMHFVPSALNYFLAGLPGKAAQLTSLRRVFASGEALLASAVDQFRDLLYQVNGTDLVNLYGPTEATIDVTSYDCFKNPVSTAVPIGKPIDNIRMYVVDQNNQLAPLGVRGQICIGGVGVFDGYLNNPELTAKVLVPGRGIPDPVIYKTGDLGYWNEAGDIQYLGRLDNQVKARGFRIELEEIEYHLQQLPGVKRAITAVMNGTRQGDEQVIVAVLWRSDAQSFAGYHYRNELRKTLPDYMIPYLYMELGNVELTKHDKLDRKSIFAYFETMGHSQVYDVRKANEQEQRLIDTFQEVLQVDRMRISDNFFEMGGHSLKAVMLLNRVESQHGVRIDFDDLMFMNLEQLAAKYFG